MKKLASKYTQHKTFSLSLLAQTFSITHHVTVSSYIRKIINKTCSISHPLSLPCQMAVGHVVRVHLTKAENSNCIWEKCLKAVFSPGYEKGWSR